MTDFFISYAREDRPFAGALVQQLEAYKWDVWIDEADIPPSVPWMVEIQRAIDESMMVIAIESSDWLVSDACHIEVELADRGRVPIIRIPPHLDRLDALVTQVVAAYRALPEWRPIVLQAAASAAVWVAAGRKKSLLARGRPLAIMRKTATARPEDFSQAAMAFIKTSTRVVIRRWIARSVLGLLAPALALGILVSLLVAQQVNEKVAENIANATVIAERSTYADWNIYSALERSPTNVSESYAAYYQLFSFLGVRTPSDWDSTPVSTLGPADALSPDGTMQATTDGVGVIVTTDSGMTRRLLASATVTSLAWSPDSRWIAVSSDAGADVISVDNGQVIPLRGGSGVTTTVRWEDAQHVTVGSTVGTGTWQVFDGTRIATLEGVRYGTTVGGAVYTVDSAGTITKTETTSGHSTPLPWDVPVGARPVMMDSAGSLIVVALDAAQPFLHLINADDGSSRDVSMPGCHPASLSLAPDASAAYLACDSEAANETRVDLVTGAVISQAFQVQMAYGVRALDDRVLWGGAYGGVFQSDLDLTPRGSLTSSAGCLAPIRKFVGHSDGSDLFLIGDVTGSFGCATRIEIGEDVKVNRLLFDPTDGHAVPDAATSPDGSLIAYGLSDGRVRVYTVGNFDPVYYAQVLPDQVRVVSFSPDGKRLTVVGLGGEVVVLPIHFAGAEQGAKDLEAEALRRLQNAVDWGIYAPTMEPNPT